MVRAAGEDAVGSDSPSDDVRLTGYPFFPVAEGCPTVVIPCHLEHARVGGHPLDPQAWLVSADPEPLGPARRLPGLPYGTGPAGLFRRVPLEHDQPSHPAIPATARRTGPARPAQHRLGRPGAHRGRPVSARPARPQQPAATGFPRQQARTYPQSGSPQSWRGSEPGAEGDLGEVLSEVLTRVKTRQTRASGSCPGTLRFGRCNKCRLRLAGACGRQLDKCLGMVVSGSRPSVAPEVLLAVGHGRVGPNLSQPGGCVSAYAQLLRRRGGSPGR